MPNTIVTRLLELRDTISALKAIIEAQGCEITDTDGLQEVAVLLNDKFNAINNRLIGITGTNKGRTIREEEYKQDLEDIKAVLTSLGVDNDKYEDLDDVLKDSYTAIYTELENILGEVPIDNSQTVQIEQLTSNLDNIKDVLIDLGIDVTDDYSDLATIISNSYNDILSQLQDINNGESNE